MKKWEKGLALCAACLCVVIGLAGCQKGEPANEALDIDAAITAVKADGGFTEELVKLDDSTLLKSYPTLDLTKIEEYSCNVSGSFATPEEASIFKGKTAEDAAAILAAVERRVEDQTLNFEDYRPDEMPKLKNAVILTKGDYVLLAVCASSDAARKVYEEAQ